MKILNWISRLIEKSKFPKVESVEHELKKAGILRIILGLVIFVRFFEISYSMYFVNQSFTIIPTLTILIIVLYIIGFSVPLVSILFLVLVRGFDAYANTNTLGLTILFQVILVMFFDECGTILLGRWVAE